jgi:hypothetical protein
MKNYVNSGIGNALLLAIVDCEPQLVVELTGDVAMKNARVADETGDLLFQTSFKNSTMVTTAFKVK